MTLRLLIASLVSATLVTGAYLGAGVSDDLYDRELMALWDEAAELCPKGYSKPVGASQESWDAVQPYLIPSNHPAKKALDLIFSQQPRPLLSSKNMKKAGFFNYTPSDKNIIVTGHPRLKGYLIKAYLDSCSLPEWKLWIQRIVGANQIRQSIEELGYTSIMKAPRKWIYPLPGNPSPPEGEEYFPKYYVLIVQDMGLFSAIANQQNWRHAMTPNLLASFYNMVMINGLIDSYYIDNSPFSFDRKIAFVDTEHYNIDIREFPGRQEILYKFLSPAMREYWEHLLQNGGP